MDNQPPILPPTPITKPNNLLPVLLSLLALFLLATTALFAYQTVKLQQRLTNLERSLVQATPTSTPTPTDTMADWKTYSNSKYQFGFKYPPTWNIDSSTPNYLSLSSSRPTNQQASGDFTPGMAWLSLKISTESPQIIINQIKDELTQEKQTLVGGQKTIVRFGDGGVDGSTYTETTVFSYNANTYIFSFSTQDEQLKSTFQNEINQILSTFKFTTPTPTGQTQTVKLYFHDLSRDPQVLTCQANSFENRQIPVTQTPLTATINLLIQDSFSKDQNYTDRLKNFKLVSATVTNGVAKLTFSDPQYFTSGGSCRIAIITDAIEKTAKQFPSVQSIQLLGAPFQP